MAFPAWSDRSCTPDWLFLPYESLENGPVPVDNVQGTEGVGRCSMRVESRGKVNHKRGEVDSDICDSTAHNQASAHSTQLKSTGQASCIPIMHSPRVPRVDTTFDAFVLSTNLLPLSYSARKFEAAVCTSVPELPCLAAEMLI